MKRLVQGEEEEEKSKTGGQGETIHDDDFWRYRISRSAFLSGSVHQHQPKLSVISATIRAIHVQVKLQIFIKTLLPFTRLFYSSLATSAVRGVIDW